MHCSKKNQALVGSLVWCDWFAYIALLETDNVTNLNHYKQHDSCYRLSDQGVRIEGVETLL